MRVKRLGVLKIRKDDRDKEVDSSVYYYGISISCKNSRPSIIFRQTNGFKLFIDKLHKILIL